MLPYLHLLYIQLGPVKIYTWGLFVSLGFLAAYLYLAKKSVSDALTNRPSELTEPEHKKIFSDILLYALIGSMLGARLVFIFFYSGNAAEEMKNFFKIWQGGMSSFGGFLGGILAAYIYTRIKKIKFLWLANRVAFVLPLGLAIARIGCYLVNDHPGVKTWAHPLSVNYPDGPRYDLGLLLFIFDALIFLYFLLRRKPFNVLTDFLLIYGAGRFLLDFLRVGEIRYVGLFPSQYGSIILVIIGIYLCLCVFFNRESSPKS